MVNAGEGLAGLGVVGAGGLLACVYPPWLRPLHKLRASLRNRPKQAMAEPWPLPGGALDEAIVGIELADCDAYVGVSAGGFIAAALANGMSPREAAPMLAWVGAAQFLPVLLLTARGSERVAVQAMKAGAYDYLVKPFDIDELVHAVARAVEARVLRRAHRRQLAERGLERPIVGEAPALRRLLDLAARVFGRVTQLHGGRGRQGRSRAAALGFARHAMDEALRRATTRPMFNQKLADFQITQTKLAQMATAMPRRRTNHSEVSATSARHSRVQLSITVRMRKRRPSVSWSATKSSDQRSLGRSGTSMGARVPMARLRPPRRRTESFSSR